ncbi:MAG TPA: stage II sporulation protein M [Methanobacterium sp.]|nr:stage II sporulation protein M [Methanobacterium sp.]
MFFWASVLLFFGPLIISYLFAGFLDSILSPVLNNFQQKVNDGTIKLETASLFINNTSVAIYIYFGGLLVGIVTALLLIINGAFIGYVASKVPLGDFIIFTLPHGIFEITGIILAGTAGFKLASIVWHFLNDVTKIKRTISINTQIAYLLKANYSDFKDSLALFIMAVILLIIAAFIEANLSIVWGQYIQSRL